MPSEEGFRYGIRPGRILLSALLKGLADAVRRNDGAAADRYRRRISLIAPQFDTNAPVRECLDRLLSVSGQWSATKVAERHQAEQPVLDLIERVSELI
jgi:hypothetical protein